MRMFDQLPLSERQQFYCDITKVSWDPYVKSAIVASAIHLRGEDHLDP